MQWSISRLKRYLKCPYDWKMHYIDGLPDPTSEDKEAGIKLESEVDVYLLGGRTHPSHVEAAFSKYKGMEYKSQMRIQTEVKYDDKIVPFIGILDYVFYSDDKIILIDLKCPRRFSSWNASRAKKDYQLSIYKALLSKIDKRKIEPLYLTINREDYRVRELPASDDTSMFFSDLYYATEGVANNNFECKSNPLCSYCTHYGQCPQTKGLINGETK